MKDPGVSFHRFPRDPALRNSWLEIFQLQESDLKPSTRVCSRHFPNGNVKKMPSITIGEFFGNDNSNSYSIFLFTKDAILSENKHNLG